jgi:SAM-dependent methyltransferase
MDVRSHNRIAWDRQVAGGSRWTVPVSSGEVARARAGDWEILLTPTRPVPREWLGDLEGRRVLALGSGGGQQGPVLAAAGARVTVLDNSPAQLAQDRLVAARDDLDLDTVEGDMADLSPFPAGSFDVVVNPCSTCFVPDVRPVWREAFRVLRPGGSLLAGLVAPVVYAADPVLQARGVVQLLNRIPWSDPRDLGEAERTRRGAAGEPLEFGHALEDLVGGQLEAGFRLAGLFEDGWPELGAIDEILRAFLATRALKP